MRVEVSYMWFKLCYIQLLSFFGSEFLYDGDYFLIVFGQVEQEILVATTFHHTRKEWIYRHFLRPEVGAIEYHRTAIAEAQVMILRGILEYFLYRTSTSWRINDAAECYCQDCIFANAVVKELSDVRRKRSCRLVTVEPSRNAKALELVLGEAFYDSECRLEPPFVLE